VIAGPELYADPVVVGVWMLCVATAILCHAAVRIVRIVGEIRRLNCQLES